MLAEAGDTEAAENAAELVMLRDGAVMAAALGDADALRASLTRAVRHVLERAGVV